MATSTLPINWQAVYGQQNTAAQMLSDFPFKVFESLQTAPLSQSVAQLEQQLSTYQSQDSAWSALQQDANGFSATWQPLGTSTAWNALQATSSDTGVAQAAADQSATAGTYAINVKQLALQQIDGMAPSTALTSTSAALSSLNSSWTGASLSLTVGSQTYTVAVTASTSLAGVAAAINNLGAGVTANVVNGGTSTSPSYYLQLVAQHADTALSFGGGTGATADWTALGILNSSGSVNVVQAAQPAIVALGSSSVSSASNTISNLIPGVTLTLEGAGTSTITVTPDVTGMAKQVTSAVATWNQWVNDTFKLAFGSLPSTSGTTEASNPKQVLHTALPMMTINGIANTFSTLTAGSASLSLADIGITLATSGGKPTLSVNQATLESAITAHPHSVQALFTALVNDVTPAANGFGQGAQSTAGIALAGDHQTETQIQSQIAQDNAAIAQIQKNAQSEYQAWASQLNQMANEENMMNAMMSNLVTPAGSGSSSSSGGL